MRKKIVLTAAAILLGACGDSSVAVKQTPAEKQAPAAKPDDESRRLPHENLVSSTVVDRALMGKAFMPGGTRGHYRKGKLEYDVFLARMADANAAAFALPDWRKAMTDAKLIPSFGGYFGIDGAQPVFVFAKGSWIAGVAGLPQKDADAVAREVAARLN